MKLGADATFGKS